MTSEKKNKPTPKRPKKAPAPTPQRQATQALTEILVEGLGAMKGQCPHNKEEVISVKQCDSCLAEATVYVAQNFLMNQLAYEIEQANFMQVAKDMEPDQAVDFYRAGLAQLLRGKNPTADLTLANITPTQIFVEDEDEEK